MNAIQKRQLNKILEPEHVHGDTSIDDALTRILISRTVAEICLTWSQSCNLKGFVIADMIMSAIFEPDINLINQIIKRVDGTVPNVERKDEYDNLIGKALDEVLKIEKKEQLTIHPMDLGMIALAKAIIYIATDKPGKNAMRKKDRTKAAEILLSRTGGARTEPVKQKLLTEYKRPEWALDSGE